MQLPKLRNGTGSSMEGLTSTQAGAIGGGLFARCRSGQAPVLPFLGFTSALHCARARMN